MPQEIKIKSTRLVNGRVLGMPNKEYQMASRFCFCMARTGRVNFIQTCLINRLNGRAKTQIPVVVT